VLKVLEELNIPVDYIAGASMGAVIGGLYAAGNSADEIETIFREFDWDLIMRDRPLRKNLSYRRKQEDKTFLVQYPMGFNNWRFQFPQGALQGQNLIMELTRTLWDVRLIHDFDQLPIPFRAITVDIEKGEEVVLDSGNLALAMRASMALPGIFSPVPFQGKLLIDGGLFNNVPIDVVREMGADIVIAVDISSQLKPREELTSMLAVFDQAQTASNRRSSDAQIATLKDHDILIRPEIVGISMTEFHKSPEAIKFGEEAARQVQDQLKSLSLSDLEYAKHKKSRKKISSKEKTIDEIRVTTDSKISKKIILNILQIKPGDPLDMKKIHENIQIIYGLGYFQLITIDFREEDKKNVLTIVANRRSWGPHYLQLGIAAEENFEGPGSYALRVRRLKTELNQYGAEMQSDFQIGGRPTAAVIEYYQPLEKRLRYFMAARVGYAENTLKVIPKSRETVQFRVKGG